MYLVLKHKVLKGRVGQTHPKHAFSFDAQYNAVAHEHSCVDNARALCV